MLFMITLFSAFRYVPKKFHIIMATEHARVCNVDARVFSIKRPTIDICSVLTFVVITDLLCVGAIC